MKLQKFSGETLRLSPAARITPSFREPLLELEQVVREVSLRVYDRVPSSILVAASYGCRTVNGSGRRLSEHALGNAIDIKGFRFADEDDSTSAKGKGLYELEEGHERSAKKDGDSASFDVLVAKHWKARGDASDAPRRALPRRAHPGAARTRCLSHPARASPPRPRRPLPLRHGADALRRLVNVPDGAAHALAAPTWARPASAALPLRDVRAHRKTGTRQVAQTRAPLPRVRDRQLEPRLCRAAQPRTRSAAACAPR